VTCHTQPCRPCEGTYILHYLPQGDESSPRGSWGICAPALPEVITSPLATAKLEGSYEHDNFAINAIVKQLKRREDIPMQPSPKITERDYSNASGGLMEVSASYPSGLYNALYKCLGSNKSDESSHPDRLILSRMISMPMIHVFAP
jgi:hypothetical protein